MAVTINTTTFPDEKWRNYVINNVTGGSTTLTDEKINNTIHLDYVYRKSISNLKGIEYFTELKTLNVDINNLTTLDLSKNTKLTNLVANRNKLTSLNVSKCSALTDIQCFNNQLTSLDVTKNPKLGWLVCSGNKLASIDVTKNPELYNFGIDNNSLTALDVSKNTKMQGFNCNNQTRTGVVISTQSNTTYPFYYSIGTANNGKLTSATVKDSNGNAITNIYSNGALHFARRPSSISYAYDIKIGACTSNFNVSITCAAVKPTITTSTLSNGYKNERYTLTLSEPTNGTWPMTLAVSGLPTGLSYNSSTRVISGTPTTTGSFTVTLKASNTAGDTTKTLTLAVYEKPTITTASLPAGINGVAYSTQLAATGTATITYSATNLPTGLSCNTTGKISGTPTVTETKSVTITAKNSYGTATKSLNLVINQKPVITTQSFNTTIPGIFYYAPNSATGTTPYVWSATNLPNGISIDPSTDVISGTPTVSGDFNINLNVKNVAGSYDSVLSLHIEKLPESMQLWRLLADDAYKYTAILSDYISQDILKNLQNIKAKVLKTDENETEIVYSNNVLKSKDLIESLEYDYVVKYADNKTYILHLASDLYIEEEAEIIPEDNYKDYVIQLKNEIASIVKYIKNAFKKL